MTKKKDNDTAREWAIEKAKMKRMKSKKNRAQLELAIETVFAGLEKLSIEMSDESIAELSVLVYADMTERGSTQEQVWQQMAKSHGVALEQCGVNIIGSNNIVVAGDVSIND